MAYLVEFTPEAMADLEALTPIIQERILRKVRWLSDNFENVSPQALSANLSGLFKLRVGDYRVIYSLTTQAERITIHKLWTINIKKTALNLKLVKSLFGIIHVPLALNSQENLSKLSLIMSLSLILIKPIGC